LITKMEVMPDKSFGSRAKGAKRCLRPCEATVMIVSLKGIGRMKVGNPTRA